MRRLYCHIVFLLLEAFVPVFAVEGIDPPRQIALPNMPGGTHIFSPIDFPQIFGNSLRNFLLADTTMRFYHFCGALGNLTLGGYGEFQIINKPKRAGENSLLKSSVFVSAEGHYERITVPAKVAVVKAFWQNAAKRTWNVNTEAGFVYRQRKLESPQWKTPFPTLVDGNIRGDFVWADRGISIFANVDAFGCQTKMHNIFSGNVLSGEVGGAFLARQHIGIKNNWGIWAQECYFLVNLNKYEIVPSEPYRYSFRGKYARRAYSSGGGIFWADGRWYFRIGVQGASNWRHNSIFPNVNLRWVRKNHYVELACGTDFASHSFSSIIRGEPEIEINPNISATIMDTIGIHIRFQYKHLIFDGWTALGKGYNFPYPYAEQISSKYCRIASANIDIVRGGGNFSFHDTLLGLPFTIGGEGIADYSKFSGSAHRLPLTPKYQADGSLTVFPFKWLNIETGVRVCGDSWLDTTFSHWQKPTMQFFGSIKAEYRKFYLELAGENLTGRTVWEFPLRFHTQRIYKLNLGCQLQ